MTRSQSISMAIVTFLLFLQAAAAMGMEGSTMYPSHKAKYTEKKSMMGDKSGEMMKMSRLMKTSTSSKSNLQHMKKSMSEKTAKMHKHMKYSKRSKCATRSSKSSSSKDSYFGMNKDSHKSKMMSKAASYHCPDIAKLSPPTKSPVTTKSPPPDETETPTKSPVSFPPPTASPTEVPTSSPTVSRMVSPASSSTPTTNHPTDTPTSVPPVSFSPTTSPVPPPTLMTTTSPTFSTMSPMSMPLETTKESPTSIPTTHEPTNSPTRTPSGGVDVPGPAFVQECYENIVTANQNQAGGTLTSDEYLEFAKLQSPPGLIDDVDNFANLPQEYQAAFVTLACLCDDPLFGGTSTAVDCCNGNDRGIRVPGPPEPAQTDADERMLDTICSLTDSAVQAVLEG